MLTILFYIFTGFLIYGLVKTFIGAALVIGSIVKFTIDDLSDKDKSENNHSETLP